MLNDRWKSIESFDKISIGMALFSFVGLTVNLTFVFLENTTDSSVWLFFLAFAIFPILFPTLFVRESSGLVFLVSVVTYDLFFIIGSLLLFSGWLNERIQRILAMLVFLASIVPVFVFSLEAALLIAAFGH
jgi:hypothetical protein